MNHDSGTASEGVDFPAISGSGTIPAGSTSVTIPISSTEDTTYEEAEIYNVHIYCTSGCYAQDFTGEVTIGNDDSPPTITISSPTVPEGNDSIFVINLSQASGVDVRFNFATADGTAISASDYYSTSGSYGHIDAGETSTEIYVTTIADAITEANETYTLNLTGITYASPSSHHRHCNHQKTRVDNIRYHSNRR